jgi:hypothetical protein
MLHLEWRIKKYQNQRARGVVEIIKDIKAKKLMPLWVEISKSACHTSIIK